MKRSKMAFGDGRHPLEVDPECVAAAFFPPPGLDPKELEESIAAIVHEQGTGSAFPLIRSILSGDKVAIPVFGAPQEVGRVLVPLITELSNSGIPENTVTVICRGKDADTYRAKLSPAVEIVAHETAVEENSAYLANSRRGTRVYLNRELLDCDVILPLIVPEPGGAEMRSGVLGGFWPEFSTASAQAKVQRDLAGVARKVRHEIREVAWLAGVSLVLIALPGAEGSIARLAALPPAEAQAWAFENFNAMWSFEFESSADSVLLIANDPAGLSDSRLRVLLRLARKLAVRYRRVVIWTQFQSGTVESMEDELRTGIKASPSWVTLMRKIGRSANTGLLGNLPQEIADACDIVLLDEPEDLQRLMQHDGKWIVIPEAWGVRARFS